MEDCQGGLEAKALRPESGRGMHRPAGSLLRRRPKGAVCLPFFYRACCFKAGRNKGQENGFFQSRNSTREFSRIGFASQLFHQANHGRPSPGLGRLAMHYPDSYPSRARCLPNASLQAAFSASFISVFQRSVVPLVEIPGMQSGLFPEGGYPVYCRCIHIPAEKRHYSLQHLLSVAHEIFISYQVDKVPGPPLMQVVHHFRYPWDQIDDIGAVPEGPGRVLPLPCPPAVIDHRQDDIPGVTIRHGHPRPAHSAEQVDFSAWRPVAFDHYRSMPEVDAGQTQEHRRGRSGDEPAGETGLEGLLAAPSRQGLQDILLIVRDQGAAGFRDRVAEDDHRGIRFPAGAGVHGFAVRFEVRATRCEVLRVKPSA